MLLPRNERSGEYALSWKKFKEIFQKNSIDESHFILGLDIGNQTSAVAYFNPISRMPEMIDMSGGYGKPSIPTILQYIADTNEWVFGEYAVLNSGASGDISLSSLAERLGKKEYAEINGRPMSIAQILAIYIRELLSYCKNINPKAEIAGIVVSVPSYVSEEAKSELLSAMKAAGYEKSVVALVQDRQCVFRRIYYDKPVENETVLLLDFGSREIRGGVYHIIPEMDGAKIKSLSSLFDKALGTQMIDDTVFDFFASFYAQQTKTAKNKFTEQTNAHLHAFAYQHKDLLFQKNRFAKPVKLYYNFAYPPFQQQVLSEDVEMLFKPFISRLNKFLSNTLAKSSSYESAITKNDISTVVCVGGGFEMLWAKEAVQRAFPNSEAIFFRNAKGVIAEGASIIATEILSVIPQKNIVIEDEHQIKADIGVKITQNQKDRFVPLIERNTFWWQPQEPKSFIINEETGSPFHIELFKRDEYGDITLLERLVLDGLPKRPAGTTRIKMTLAFNSYNKLTATVDDMGFGELFPMTDFSDKFLISL